MRRVLALLCVLGLFVGGNGQCEEGYSSPKSGVTSYCNDPNCPGCRAFLASYADSGPGCSCNTSDGGGAGGGAGGGGAGEDYGLGEDLLAGDYGGGYGYETAAPNMIGDSLIGGGVLTHIGGTQTNRAPSLYSFHTFKIAEDESPWPKNRVYFDINSYANVPGTDAITRYMTGLERTFWDGQGSLGFRLPFWTTDIESIPTTLPANVPFGAPGTSNAFGDLTVTVKAKLAEREATLLSSGLSWTIPTGPDTLGGVDPFYTMNNVSHKGNIQPWVGWYRANQSTTYGFFTQGFLAFDMPIDPDDGDYLYLDLGMGYRAPRDNGGLITAITPMFEAHWSTPIADNAQTITLTPLGTASLTGGFGGAVTGGVLGYRNQVNLTSAVNIELLGSRNLVLGFVVPTTGPKIMDYELICQFNAFNW